MQDGELARARILVVDDEEANVDLLEQLLARAGYGDVVGTTDPRRVLPLYRERPPDLILLDLIMPHLDGFAVMQQIRAERSEQEHVPVLVLTADVTTATKQRALAGGATDFLTKPFDHVELLLRVRNLIEIRMLHVQLQTHARVMERLAEEARSAVRARDAVVSMVSHDIGQPLAAVRVAARLIRRQAERIDAEQADELRRNIALVESATDKMFAMAGELSDMARAQAGRPLDLNLERFDLLPLIADEVRAHQAQTERHTIRLETAEAALEGEWDAMRLTRVISNLLSNAVRYSPEGGPVTVRAWCEQDGGREWAVVTVEDRGIGIPAHDQHGVFRPFFRAANTAGQIPGTGIGLSGARRIVEQHGGTIGLTSREGEGTTVTLRLPLDR
jgi:signal transduction histidine kinase